MRDSFNETSGTRNSVPVSPEEHSANRDDDQLVERCRRGDRDALTIVFRENATSLANLLARLCGRSQDIEDLLQLTFAEAITAFPRFRGDASVRTWLSRIAVNVVRQHWRKQTTRTRARLELVPLAETASDDAPQLTDVADARAQLAKVYELLMKVGEKKRLAFALHVFDGRSMEEVAALTGATVTATRSRVYWARRALRAAAKRDPILERFCGARSDV